MDRFFKIHALIIKLIRTLYYLWLIFVRRRMLENWRPLRLLRVMFVQMMARLAEARPDLVGREDDIT